MIKHMGDQTSTKDQTGIVARRFLAVRLEQQLSQQAFADALGISLRGEQNYERGVRKLPADVLLELARQFQVDPLWIVDGPEERPRYLAAIGLDQQTLARAIRIVQRAFAEAKKPIDDQEFPAMVAAVYQFYLDNASGAGADRLVNNLIGATA